MGCGRSEQTMAMQKPGPETLWPDQRQGAPMTNPQKDTATLFLEHSRKKLLGEWWPRLQTAVEPISEEQLWWRPNQASNSIGNLLLHLNGNVRQWMVASFDRREDQRNRPAEFSEKSGGPPSAVLAMLGATMNEASAVLSRLTEQDLLAPYEIQGYHVTGLEAVYQVVEHFGLHYGQIVYITKALQGKDLGFYSELNRTGRAG
jgi:uncharacterized damage-inducible protein DinB